jgi:hypothetical protein
MTCSTCSTCGARLRAESDFCGQCFTAVTPAVAPRTGPPPGELRFTPSYSRWRKTDTTFGPLGRSLWTLAVVLVMAMAVFSQNPFAIGPLCLIFAPVVLRSVWAKGRVT